MECDYIKYGCSTKFTNAEHQQLHLQGLVHQHLKLVVHALEKELEKNKTLSTTVDTLQGRLEQAEKKIKTNELLEDKVKEFESKLQLLQGLFEKSSHTETKQNGTLSDADLKESQSKVTFPKSSYSKQDDSRSYLPPRTGTPSSMKSTWEREDKAREEKLREEKARDEKAREEKAREEKIKEEKAREEKAKEDKRLAEERAKKAEEDRLKESRPALTSPPPYIAKASPFEPTERRPTSMSLREEPHRSRSKTWSNTSSRKKDVESSMPLIPSDVPLETGVIWEYDSVADEWCRGACSFRMIRSSFAEGALRTAHMLEIHGDLTSADKMTVEKSVLQGKTLKNGALPTMGLLGDKYVAKLSKTKVPVERYFEDVKMQMVCVELAKQFNQQGTPKKVEFLTAWVLEIPKPTGSIWCGLEHYIGGEFKKQSNNHGGVLEPRNTPQAFSHFTWEHSKHTLIVVDLQGVDDDYTDPQIHTKDGLGYGVGNLGKTGIDRFLKTHQCNAVCTFLCLPRINTLDSKSALQKLIKGTQQVPFIDDQLGQGIVFPHLDVAPDITTGEFQCVHTFSGHVDRVVSLCVTPKHLFSGSSDGSLRVWGLAGLTFEKELNVHRKSVEAICANDKYLFTASADHSIKVWDITTFALVIALRDHVGEVNAIALTDKSLNYLCSASFDKNIKVWSLRTFKCVQTLSGHNKCVRTLAVSGSILFSGSNDGSIYMWSLKTMQSIFGLDAHEGWVKTLVIKDKTLYSGSFDFHIKEWNITAFQSAELLMDHNDNVNSLCLTDKYLISGSDDKTALVWDMAERKVVAVIKGHRLGVQAVVTDGKYIYTASDDCSIKAWKWFGGDK